MGGIAETGFVRSAISEIATFCSFGGVPATTTSSVGVSSRSVPLIFSPFFSVIDTVP